MFRSRCGALPEAIQSLREQGDAKGQERNGGQPSGLRWTLGEMHSWSDNLAYPVGG